MTDDRSSRERHRSSGGDIDLWTPGEPIPGQRVLVRVYSGGSLPTTAGKVFLCHPVVVSFDDAEGAGGTTYDDTSQTIPVLVVGKWAPIVNDLITAHAVGGRWVADEVQRGARCSSFLKSGITPQNLYWTDPYLGSFTLALDNATTDPGACAWSGCKDVTFAGSSLCTAKTVKYAVFCRQNGSSNWQMSFSWAVLAPPGPCGPGVGLCPDTGSSAVCDWANYGTYGQIIGSAVLWIIGGAASQGRPFSKTFTYTLSVTQSYSYLIGNTDCNPAHTFGPSTWTLSE